MVNNKFKIKKGIAMFTYDEEANAMYVDLSTYYKDKHRINEDPKPATIIFDHNNDGEIVGIEILLSDE